MSLPGGQNIYTLGYSPAATQMMAGRTAASHAGFLLPYLRAGMHVLDCGCGPGSITLGLAEVVAPGEVVGIDLEPSQVALARTQAAHRSCSNVRFDVGDVRHLPYADAMFDAVFGHTILIQFHDPLPASSRSRESKVVVHTQSSSNSMTPCRCSPRSTGW